MAETHPESDGKPPPYQDDENTYTQDEMLLPSILVLAGQSIHAESADSAPLYQTNRGIANLTHATSEIEFERLERSVKSTSGDPAIKSRPRQLYALKYMRNAPGSLEGMPSDSPHYFITAVSSRTIGNIGLKKARLRTHWKALPLDMSGKNSKFGIPQFVKDAKPLFEISHKNKTYKWTDGDGKDIAVEDEGEDQHRLIITEALRRDHLDALVALWCCRLWQHHADNAKAVKEGMEGVMRKLRLSSEVLGHNWTMKG